MELRLNAFSIWAGCFVPVYVMRKPDKAHDEIFVSLKLWKNLALMTSGSVGADGPNELKVFEFKRYSAREHEIWPRNI